MEETNYKKPVFKANTVERGSGLAIQLAKELVEFLQLTKNDTVGMIAENGKHGDYISIYKIENE